MKTLIYSLLVRILGANEVETGYPFCHKGDAGKLFRRYTDPLTLKYSTTNCVLCYTVEGNRTPNKKDNRLTVNLC